VGRGPPARPPAPGARAPACPLLLFSTRFPTGGGYLKNHGLVSGGPGTDPRLQNAAPNSGLPATRFENKKPPSRFYTAGACGTELPAHGPGHRHPGPQFPRAPGPRAQAHGAVSVRPNGERGPAGEEPSSWRPRPSPRSAPAGDRRIITTRPTGYGPSVAGLRPVDHGLRSLRGAETGIPSFPACGSTAFRTMNIRSTGQVPAGPRSHRGPAHQGLGHRWTKVSRSPADGPEGPCPVSPGWWSVAARNLANVADIGRDGGPTAPRAHGQRPLSAWDRESGSRTFWGRGTFPQVGCNAPPGPTGGFFLGGARESGVARSDRKPPVHGSVGARRGNGLFPAKSGKWGGKRWDYNKALGLTGRFGTRACTCSVTASGSTGRTVRHKRGVNWSPNGPKRVRSGAATRGTAQPRFGVAESRGRAVPTPHRCGCLPTAESPRSVRTEGGTPNRLNVASHPPTSLRVGSCRSCPWGAAGGPAPSGLFGARSTNHARTRYDRARRAGLCRRPGRVCPPGRPPALVSGFSGRRFRPGRPGAPR